MTCAACAFENRVLARFCGRCGASLRPLARCPRCSTPNPVDYEYCDGCGTHFTIGGRSPGTPALAVSAAAGPAASAAKVEQADVDYTWSWTIAPPYARLMTLVGVAVAGLGEGYLQWAEPTTRTKAVGLACLASGAILFGLGATVSFLPKALQNPRLPTIPIARVFRRDTSGLAAAVGILSFLTLLVRLLLGSTAGTDLVLWAVALAAFAMPLVGDVTLRRPSRGALLEAAALAVVTLVVVAANAQDLDDWYYSAIGDEYAFLAAANGQLVDGISKPFVQEGVYGAHPVLGTIFQAGVMKVVGRNHVGWVFSSVLSHALAVPAVYLFGRVMGGPGVGIVAAALFGFCHYLFAFAHLGYNNIMAQAPTAWAMACFALYLSSRRRWLLYASGVAAGLGFYTFYTARTTLPILGLFVLLLYGWRACLTPRGFRDRMLELWPLLLGFLLAVAPIFAASGLNVILRMFSEVPGGYSAEITGPPGQKILNNVWLNVPAFFVNTHIAHYVSGSLLDPVTAVLAALGLGLAIRWRTSALALLLLVWTLVAVAVTALLSPHPTTAVTRLLFDVPPLAVLGALAARQIAASVPWPSAESARQWAAVGATAALLLVVLGLNLQRFWVTTPGTVHLTQDAVVMGALRSGICGRETARTVLVMRGHGLFRGAFNSYSPNLVERDLPRLVTHADLKPGEPIPLDSARCIIFGDPNDDSARRAIDDLKRAHPSGEVAPFRDLAGKGTIMIFRPASSDRP